MQPNLIHAKVLQLCEYIFRGENSGKRNYLVEKCRVLRLPLSSQFLNERYVYNIALASINIMMESDKGFQLAAIFLKGLFIGKTYWDILHFLNSMKSDILSIMSLSQDVIERIQVQNVSFSHNLLSSYKCHCISKIKPVPLRKNGENKRLDKSVVCFINLSLNDTEGEDSTRGGEGEQKQVKMGKKLNLKEGENKPKNESLNFLEFNKCINLEAELIDLDNEDSEEEEPNQVGEQNLCECITINLDSPEEDFCILINDRIDQEKSSEGNPNVMENELDVLSVPKNSLLDRSKFNFNPLDIFKIRNQVLNGNGKGENESEEEIEENDPDVIDLKSFRESKNFENSHDTNPFSELKSNVKKLCDSQIQNIYKSKSTTLVNSMNEFLGKNLNEISTSSSKESTLSEIVERCQICFESFHPFCQKEHSFMCNKCYIRESSLKFRVILDLFAGYVDENSFLTTINFDCPNAESARIDCCDSFIVEIRIQFISHNDDQTKNHEWCEETEGLNTSKSNKRSLKGFMFYINYQPIAVKANKEGAETCSFKIPLKLLEEKNTLVIENTKLSLAPRKYTRKLKGVETQAPPERYLLVGIYKVVPREKRKEFINGSLTKLPHSSVKLFYQSLFLLEKYKNTNPLKFQIVYPSTSKPLEIPLRSFQCQHPECFDFSEIVNDMNKMKNGNGFKWKKSKKSSKSTFEVIDKDTAEQKNKKEGVLCPICSVEIKGLYVDTLIQDYIQSEKKNSNPDYFMFIYNQNHPNFKRRNFQDVANLPNHIFLEISQTSSRPLEILEAIDVDVNSEPNLNCEMNEEIYLDDDSIDDVVVLNSTEEKSETLSGNVRPAIYFSDSDLSEDMESVIENISKRNLIEFGGYSCRNVVEIDSDDEKPKKKSKLISKLPIKESSQRKTLLERVAKYVYPRA